MLTMSHAAGAGRRRCACRLMQGSGSHRTCCPPQATCCQTRLNNSAISPHLRPCHALHRPQDINRYIRCTLLSATNNFQEVVAAETKASLAWLGKNGFVE